MRTPRKLAIASAALGLLGLIIACSSSDNNNGGYANGGNSQSGDGGGGKSGGGGLEGGGGDTVIIPLDNTAPETTDFDGCAKETATADLKPANLLFVIDRTGSMNCNPPPLQSTAECEVTPTKKDPSQQSKWEITRDALKDAIQALYDATHTSTLPVPSVGIMYFNDDDYCHPPDQPVVDVAELSVPQINTLNISLDAVIPKGDTPIVGAMMRAYEYLYAHASEFKGNLFVVLLTDGAETCDIPNKDFLLGKTKEVADALGIRTFVLGAPGSDTARSFLSQLAFNGGTPSNQTCQHDPSEAEDVGDCHIDMTQSSDFKTTLKDALQKVSGEALSCELDVPQPDGGVEFDPNQVNVAYSSTENDAGETWLPRDDTSCNDSNKGWQYKDSSHTKILLCGSACAMVKSDPHASVSVILGCPTTVY